MKNKIKPAAFLIKLNTQNLSKIMTSITYKKSYKSYLYNMKIKNTKICLTFLWITINKKAVVKSL